MSDDQSEPLQRIVQHITQQQQQACQQILAEARATAARIVATAEAEAVRRTAAAQEAEERRLAEAQATVQARQETEDRQHRLQQTQAVLEQGWTLLLEQLAQRWASAEHRALWLAMLVRQAQQTFPLGDWTVQHPPAWDPEELRLLHPDPRFDSDPHLTAGLRIGCRGAWLDGSVQGMMANRRELSALLLAQLEKKEAYP
ncbi:MAG: hypothetical protein HQL87_13370 [Magnetococcales bacterium]|nr:hypothetical protein [Magnetococcales bacterium]